VRNEYLIRPLLFAGREAIMAYAREKGIQWREDSSNASDDYTRNMIRRQLIPRMQEINAAFLSTAAQTLRHVRAADENLRFLLGRLLGSPDTSGKYRMNKKELETLPSPADALFDLLQPFGFTPEQMRQLMENWQQTGTEWTSGSGFRLLNDRQELLLFRNTPERQPIRIDADDIMVGLPDGSRLIFMPAEPIAPFEQNYAAVVVDADKLRFPLLLRRWQPGDVFQPLGMGGRSRKLQDFFTDRKLSRLEKEQVWILENGDKNIIWIVGMRLDERFKIETETSNLLKISWVKQL
jgi:tRNA(Ile)-lysidine synthase